MNNTIKSVLLDVGVNVGVLEVLKTDEEFLFDDFKQVWVFLKGLKNVGEVGFDILWVLSENVHNDRYADDCFGFEFFLAQEDDHVDVEARYEGIFIEDIADVVGHVPDEIVIFVLNQWLECTPHHSEHAFLEFLQILLGRLDQVCEWEHSLQLIWGQVKIGFAQVNLAEHQYFHFLVVYDPQFPQYRYYMMEVLRWRVVYALSCMHQVLIRNCPQFLPLLVLNVLLNSCDRSLARAWVQESRQEEVSSVFRFVCPSVVLFFLNFQLVNPFENFFFGKENSAYVAFPGNFILSLLELSQVQCDSIIVVRLWLALNWNDLFSDLGFFGLSEFLESEFLLSFSNSLVSSKVVLDSWDAF